MTARTILIVLAAVPLTACGPKTAFSMLFPVRYATATTVEFHDGDRTVTQTLRYRCQAVDETDSIAANTITRIEGERHWFKRADNSILVLGELGPCPWAAPPPEGATRDVFPTKQEFAGDSYLFDSADNPARVEVLDTDALFQPRDEPKDDLWAANARLYLVKGEADRTLHQAFPGLARIPAGVMGGSYGWGGGLRPGAYVGISAEIWRLTNGTQCNPEGSGKVVVLARTDRCNFVTSCGGRQTPVGDDEPIACGEREGWLPARPDRGFNRVDVTLAEGDTRSKGTLYGSAVVQGAGGPAGPWAKVSEWRPQVCVEGRCVEQGSLRTAFYFPTKDMVVIVGVMNRSFAASTFDEHG